VPEEDNNSNNSVSGVFNQASDITASSMLVADSNESNLLAHTRTRICFISFCPPFGRGVVRDSFMLFERDL
jgi:hypothetical protein